MLTIPDSDVRMLMNMLLAQGVFDGFELRSCTIQSFARFDIEGVPVAEAAEAAEGETRKAVFCKWQRIRPYVYNILKGSEKPRFMKFVFSAAAETLVGELAEAQALFINIIFDKNTVHITTGASMKAWSLDKTVENQWDSHVVDFIKQNNIPISEE